MILILLLCPSERLILFHTHSCMCTGVHKWTFIINLLLTCCFWNLACFDQLFSLQISVWLKLCPSNFIQNIQSSGVMFRGQKKQGTRASLTQLVLTFFRSYEEQLCVVPALVFLLSHIYLPLSRPVGEATRSHTPFLNLQVAYHQLLFDRVKQESWEESNSIIKGHPPGSWCVYWRTMKNTATSKVSPVWSSEQQF